MSKWTTDYELTCVECGNVFHASNKDAMFCCYTCKSVYTKRREALKKSNELIANGIENEDYVIDRWNGLACKRMYGGWMKTMHPGKTSADYKKEFPNALLCCKKDKENTSKNSGQFMKTDEYRKKYSEMLKGENNPNHKSKTTEQQRKERSPFSKEFYKARGRNEEEVHDFVKTALKDRLTETQLEYWIAKGYNEEEAKKKLSERQRTFTLEKCIEKYGEIEGLKRWKERQKKWSKSFAKSIKNGYSGIELMFVESILEKMSDVEAECCYSHISKNHQFCIDSYRYDFCYKNKIVEFNGDYWHANPKMYDKDYYIARKEKTAEEIWKYDNYKKKRAEKEGYKVLVVWESEYNDNPDATIQKCIDFIKS